MSREDKRTILVADDVKLFQLFVKQTLNSPEYDLIFVEKGKDALDTIMKKDVDLLILDVELPDMTGLEVLRNIRKLIQDMQSVVQLKELPVIMVTAYPKEEIRREAEILGVAGFFEKPVNRKEFRRLVRDILFGDYRVSRKRKLILCVDSEPRVQKFYQGVLAGKYWDVVTSSDGIEALEAVEFKNPDLIITELNLPQMDGVEFLQTLKETGKDIPVIVVSSLSESEGMEKVKELGVKKYLTKPFQLEELRKSIEEVLSKKGGVSNEQ